MESQVQVVQMRKHVSGNLPDRMGSNPSEDGVTKFIETGGSCSGDTIYPEVENREDCFD